MQWLIGVEWEPLSILVFYFSRVQFLPGQFVDPAETKIQLQAENGRSFLHGLYYLTVFVREMNPMLQNASEGSILSTFSNKCVKKSSRYTAGAGQRGLLCLATTSDPHHTPLLASFPHRSLRSSRNEIRHSVFGPTSSLCIYIYLFTCSYLQDRWCYVLMV